MFKIEDKRERNEKRMRMYLARTFSIYSGALLGPVLSIPQEII
jgi:hypothetical protein